MFEGYPVASRRTFSWHDKKITDYLDTKEFLKETKVEVVESFGAIPFAELLGSQRCLCGSTKEDVLVVNAPTCFANAHSV